MRPALLAVSSVMFVAACDPGLGLPKAQVENEVDTVSLFALSGTPVASPSGYFLLGRRPVRTDQEPFAFDFVFDIDTAGRAVLLPTGALKLGRLSGVQLSATAFDSIVFAPNRDYQLDSAVVVDVDSVAILHSRPADCGNLITAVYYAKLRVLEIDRTADPGGRWIKFEILVNRNCGYRGLELGVPAR